MNEKNKKTERFIAALICLILTIGLTVSMGAIGFLMGLIVIYFNFRDKDEEEPHLRQKVGRRSAKKARDTVGK